MPMERAWSHGYLVTAGPGTHKDVKNRVMLTALHRNRNNLLGVERGPWYQWEHLLKSLGRRHREGAFRPRAVISARRLEKHRLQAYAALWLLPIPPWRLDKHRQALSTLLARPRKLR